MVYNFVVNALIWIAIIGFFVGAYCFGFSLIVKSSNEVREELGRPPMSDEEKLFMFLALPFVMWPTLWMWIFAILFVILGSIFGFDT